MHCEFSLVFSPSLPQVVNVYRLVTENTIEEKVVTRAQQKLKLDAMVVQQGRLQNKDKLSKNELLDALRFGADKVFRSGGEDLNVTDEDIELILDRGQKKTAEMQAKLEDMDKGDLLDFKLDGGMKTQEFEGEDFSSRKRPVIDPLLVYEDDRSQPRAARKESTYAETYQAPNMQTKPKKKGAKLPEHLRLPRMQEWHFLNEKRLYDIASTEESLYLELDPEGLAASTTLRVLPPELEAEKAALLAEGFPSWSRAQFTAFHKASATYGRDDIPAIASEIIGKDEDETRAYHAGFWSKGPTAIGDFQKILKNIEKGEKKVQEFTRMTNATKASTPSQPCHTSFACPCIAGCLTCSVPIYAGYLRPLRGPVAGPSTAVHPYGRHKKGVHGRRRPPAPLLNPNSRLWLLGSYQGRTSALTSGPVQLSSSNPDHGRHHEARGPRHATSGKGCFRDGPPRANCHPGPGAHGKDCRPSHREETEGSRTPRRDREAPEGISSFTEPRTKSQTHAVLFDPRRISTPRQLKSRT